MPWRIYRYVIKEILPYLFLTLLVATTILFAREAERFAELFVKKNVPPALVHTLLVALLARILIITLPISFLIGSLLALARMAVDNELLSLYASGLSRRQMVLPVLSVGAMVALLLGYVTLVEFPRSARQIREIRGQLILQGIRTQIKPRVFDNRFVDRVLYVGDIDRENDLWKGIFLASTESGQQVLMTGQYGILELGDRPETSRLHLFNGIAHRPGTDMEGRPVYNVEGFSSYHLRFDPQSREASRFSIESERQQESVEEKSLAELLTLSSENEKLYIKARVEAGRRLALPVACLLFAPLGLGLGMSRRPTPRSYGFLLGIILSTAYYLLFFAGERLARGGLLPPLPATWMANGVFAWVALAALRDRGLFTRWDRILVSPGRLRALWWTCVRFLEQRLSDIKLRGKVRSRALIPLIDQFISRGFFHIIGLIMFSLWLIFLVFTLFELSPDVVEHQIPWGRLFEYFFYLSPHILLQLAPPCVLLASILTISLLSRTNQVVAFTAQGISAYRLAVPILAASGLLAVAMVGWGNWVVPGANVRQDQLRAYIKRGRFPSAAELSAYVSTEGWVMGQADRLFHFDYFDQQADRFSRLLVLELDDRKDMTIRRRIEASQAVWNRDRLAWQLTDARIRTFDRDRVIESMELAGYVLAIEESPEYFKRHHRKPEYMSRSELSRHITSLQQLGVDVTELRMARQGKLSLPLACLVMGLVGIPFGFTFGRRGTLFGIGGGIVLGLVYWIGLFLFSEMGKYGYVGPSLASWGPGGLFGALGLYGLFKVRS